MRRNILSCLALTMFFYGCAYQGTVAEKRFRPLPFSESLGLDAMYNFQLRDNTGQVHSQMVTADVFASYRVGDYFNDLQPPPARGEKELRGMQPTLREMDEGPYEPVRVMQMQPPKRGAANIAAHTHHRTTITAKTATSHHRAKQTSTVAHHKKTRTKVAAKHRVHHHHRKIVASLN